MAAPLYAVAAMLVLFPVADVGTQLGWQASPLTLNWRTGVVGLVGSALLTPTFGMVLALVTAHLFGHRWMQSALGVLAAVGAIVLLLVLGLFTLDSIQLGDSLTDEMRFSYWMAVGRAMFQVGFTLVVLITMSVASYRSIRRATARTR
jgi:hypothetical protein